MGFSVREDLGDIVNDTLYDDTLYVEDRQYNQPFQARFSLYLNYCPALCLAYHDDAVTNPNNMLPTFFTVPPFGQNAYSVTMCYVQCWQYVYEDIGDMQSTITSYFRSFGFDITDNRPDIEELWE